MLESMFIDNGIIDNTTPYYSYLCSEWTMNVAAKVILIVFGALVGHCLTILFPQSENWTISLWNHHVFVFLSLILLLHLPVISIFT